MGLSFLSPLWFELLVVGLLLARSAMDTSLRSRSPAEIVVLLAAGVGLVALIRAEQLPFAAVGLVLLVLADAAWVHSRAIERCD